MPFLSAGFPEFECFSPVVSRLVTQFLGGDRSIH